MTVSYPAKQERTDIKYLGEVVNMDIDRGVPCLSVIDTCISTHSGRTT